MIVLDTSTLILLAKSDLLALVAEKTPLVIPPEVRREALAKPTLYDARMIAAMLQAGTIRVMRAGGMTGKKRMQREFGLEAAEASALVLAKEKGVPLATDDGPAIKAAKIVGVPFITAMYVLRELAVKGRLNRKTALAKLEILQRVGRYNVQILGEARQCIEQEGREA